MKLTITIIILLSLFSCVEDNENTFKEEYILEAFMIVGDPITNIRFMKTIPILDSFSLERALIKDAEIYIYDENGDTIKLEYNLESKLGYDAVNKSYLVKEMTKYDIRVIYKEDTIKSFTTTPKSFNWVEKAPDTLQYPIDLNNVEDQVKVKWENPGSFNFYHIVTRCIDTLEYGKYLNPQTEELNSRILLWRDEDFFFRNTTNHGLSPTNEGSIIWTTFKWYGMQEVTIYNPDYNWFRWLGQYFQSEYNDILSSVEGKNVRGVFASATAIRDTSFLKKYKK
jgi:hypothetical protein